MTESLKCPNCNAQIHITGNNITKCEYCDCEIILKNNTHENNFTYNTLHNHPVINQNIYYNVPKPAPIVKNTINYEEKKKRWNKTLKITLTIEAMIPIIINTIINPLLRVLFLDFTIIEIIYSIIVSIILYNTKPLNEKEKNFNKFSNFMKVYCVVFWLTIIIEISLFYK